MSEKKKLLISFSGGRTSAYMTWWLMNEWEDRDNWEKIVLFANTGKEREETLEFIEKCDRYFNFGVIWLEALVEYKNNIGTSFKLTNFNSAARDGEPFEAVIKKYGMPNQNAPHCTRELKMQPIKAYARILGWSNYKTALGIRADEPKRLDWARAKKERLIYPFAQFVKKTKSDINLWWSKQFFDLELKSYEGNCDLCYKKGLRKLMTIVKEKPNLANWWREMENKYESFTPPTREHNAKPPYRFFRDFMTIDDIIEESKLPFEPSKDESKAVDMFKQITMWDNYLDSNGGCVESCEVF